MVNFHIFAVVLMVVILICCGDNMTMSNCDFLQCVHRDLAARNVLLGKDDIPMVSDFGLSRDVYECGFYENTTGVSTRFMANGNNNNNNNDYKY